MNKKMKETHVDDKADQEVNLLKCGHCDRPQSNGPQLWPFCPPTQKLLGNGQRPGSSDSKESACTAGDVGSLPELGRSSGGGRDNPLQYSCLENPHGQKSLAGCSP